MAELVEVLEVDPSEVDPSMEAIDEELLRTLSAREKAAVQQARAWRKAFAAAMAVVLGLVVVVMILIVRRQVQYVQVSEGLNHKVQLLPWTDRPWTLTEADTRKEIELWLRRCRAFGTDEVQVAYDRFLCWQQAYVPAQRWAKAWFDTLPTAEIGKVAIRVAQPPLPAMKSVPPVAGRTWEVFWEEEWTSVKSPQAMRKLFIALITVQVKAPENDVQALHKGLWIENMTIEERVAQEAR